MSTYTEQLPDSLPVLRPDLEFQSAAELGYPDKMMIIAGQRYFLADQITVSLLRLLQQPQSSYEALALAMQQQHAVDCDATSLQQQILALPGGLWADSPVRHPFWLRWHFFPSAWVSLIVRPLQFIFQIPVAVVLLSCFLISSMGLIFTHWHGHAADWHQAQWGLAVALGLSGTLLHELGHCAAAQRFGGRQQGIGIGVYWFWPVFYAEVHDAWRLTRWQRVTVDAGGLYFQAVYVLGLSLWYRNSADVTVLAAIWISATMMLNTLNPVMKFDGYWMLSDALKLPNLHQQLLTEGRHWVQSLQPGSEVAAPSRQMRGGLLAFVVFAGLFFGNLILFYGNMTGIQMAAMAHGFALPETDWLAVSGHALLLILLSVIAMMTALRLARSMVSVVKES